MREIDLFVLNLGKSRVVDGIKNLEKEFKKHSKAKEDYFCVQYLLVRSSTEKT